MPCQDVSAAGRRAGLASHTRSGLWSHFADAIDVLRPQIVVIENVRGLLSAKAKRGVQDAETQEDSQEGPLEGSTVELSAGAVDGGVLRAAGAVLGDLSDIGYDAVWKVVSAASVGAPHKRERCFIIGFPSSSDPISGSEQNQQFSWRDEKAHSISGSSGSGSLTDTSSDGCCGQCSTHHHDISDAHGDIIDRCSETLADTHERASSDQQESSSGQDGQSLGSATGAGDRDSAGGVAPRVHQLGGTAEELAAIELLPTPLSGEARHGSPNQHCSRGDKMLTGVVLSEIAPLLPTPQASRGGFDQSTPDAPRRPKLDHITDLLPTPMAHDSKGTGPSAYDRHTPELSRIDHYFPNEPLLPTPTVVDHRIGFADSPSCQGDRHQIHLPTAVAREMGPLLPTPSQSDTKTPDRTGKRREQGHQENLADAVENNLLPTPLSRDVKGGMAHQPDLNDALRLLPTPRSTDQFGPGVHGQGGMDLRTTVIVDESRWGKYANAIARWESVLGRPAPSPTEPNTKGNPRLSAAFSEWMMGWPAGWVTQVEGISRSDQLKIVGNGVVPQQAVAALTELLGVLAGMPPQPQLSKNETLLPTPRATRGGSNTETVELLPTPNADVSRGNRSAEGVARRLTAGNKQTSLEDAVTLLPTPCAQQSGNTPENHLAKKPGRKVVTDLAVLVENGLLETGGLLPTPTGGDSIRTTGRPDAQNLSHNTLTDIPFLLPTPQQRDAHAGPASEVGGTRPSGQPRQKDLNTVAARELLPTPTAGDGTGGGRRYTTRDDGPVNDCLRDAVISFALTPLQEAFRMMDEKQRVTLAGHLEAMREALSHLSDSEIDGIPQTLLMPLIDLTGFCADMENVH